MRLLPKIRTKFTGFQYFRYQIHKIDEYPAGSIRTIAGKQYKILGLGKIVREDDWNDRPVVEIYVEELK